MVAEEGQVYSRFERIKNGFKIKFRVQKITKDLIDLVITHMYDHYLQREPICTFLNISYDTISLEDMFESWRKCLSGGVGLVAMIENEDGSAPKTPMIVGVNVLYAYHKGDIVERGKGKMFNLVLDAVLEMLKKANLFETYGVDRYMSAFGLSVHRDYHGLGIGREILRARKTACKYFNLPMAVTVFSAPTSQYIAGDEGYEVAYEVSYKDFSFNGEKPFEKLPGKINIMVSKFV